jgi:2-dehydro-3-deoxyphosphogluconate aldolase / (4S)-4-hydroxy-2-oxoglutarate aldolase
VFSAEVLARCLLRETLAVPGAFTVTEVDAARRAGAALVKLFPAGPLGPRYVRDLLAPLGGVELLATGGIDAGNAAEFLRAGAVAVGAGGALVGADDVEAAARELVGAASRSSQ